MTSATPHGLGHPDRTGGAVGRSIAVVGASGYVGRLLCAHLAAHGARVTAIGRSLDRLPVGEGVGRRAVDVADPEAAASALEGIDAAYYLVHAMADDGDFAERDRASAIAFAEAARRAGLARVVYLGGLGGDGLSAHLSSRHEVGRLLRRSGAEVVELRAAVILGAGSISFEMLRYLTERLPAMVCPKWVDTRLQPLAERDLLAYLTQALTVPAGTYEVGTPDVTTYHDMMQAYARVRGLRRRAIVRVPLLTPSLSAHWVDLVTPVDRRVSHALIESLANEVVVRHGDRTAAVFDVQPLPVEEAIGAALEEQVARGAANLRTAPEGLGDGVYAMRLDVRVPTTDAAAVRHDLARVGGDLGWYGLAWAWRLRILLGRLVGEHLALRRPDRAEVGAAADWWRIAHLDDDSLVLEATDWFFGEAWLGYWLRDPGRATAPVPRSGSSGAVQVLQVAAFRPRGVPGLAYWRVLWPVHWLVFRAMARRRGVPLAGGP